ncbi:MAG: TerB N-terminal domain-containing protein [Chloroflexota bacterium]|nr:TerB N-terminal domain-containing protein [Chloroflexota bacterium]
MGDQVEKSGGEWVPPGEAVAVQGRQIADGMVYVGSRLRGVSRYVEIEPALIDPTLPVADLRPDIEGQYMGYWPSYSEIPNNSRAAYLDWLAAGRPAGAYIGYVFLFFYGIERRLLIDLDRSDLGDDESRDLIAEVERLLALYGENNSFRGYAGEFLSVVNCLRSDLDFANLEPPRDRRSWELPLELKLGLGSLVASGDPVSAPWALSWLRLHPETSLRTPAVRCEAEFDELFQLRYQQRHGTGIAIRRNKTTLSHAYRPASASFGSQVTIRADDVPDVSRLKRPVRQLQELAEMATEELDSFSRWVGKHKERDSLGAIALLPKELARKRQTEDLNELRGRVRAALSQSEIATLPVEDLITGFPSQRAGTFTAKEATSFAQLLESQGIGITPDLRYSNVNLTKHQHAAVFRLDAEDVEPSERYQAATVLLQLGAAVSAADGTISAEEERLLEGHLEEALHLSSADRTRLRAYLQWLLVEPPTLARMKSRMAALTASERSQVARFAITIAGADGVVSSDEVKVLNRVYNLLGLEEDQLHRDIHDLASTPPTQPVTVLRPDERTSHRIPPPPTQDRDPEIVELDQEKIMAIMKDTREVADILTDIFEGPAEPEPPEEDEEDAEVEDLAPSTADIAGGLLDQAHAELVRFLASRPNWPRSEVEEASNRLGLMPAGAIEAINEAAFALCDDPLIEGHDPLDMNELALKELLNDN